MSDVGETTPEGVTDTDLHTLHYAYYPHPGDTVTAEPWQEAYAFNQPLILVWRSGEQLNVQLPFWGEPLSYPLEHGVTKAPETRSLASAESGVIVDVYLDGDQLYALVMDYDPLTPSTLETTQGLLKLSLGWLWLTPVEIR